MRSARSVLIAACSGLVVSACSDGTGPGNSPSLVCTEGSTEALAVGEHRILDPNRDDACVRLPAASVVSEFLYVPVATAAQEVEDGVSAPYSITSSASSTPAAVRPSPMVSAFAQAKRPNAFHEMLRRRERDLSGSPSRVLFDKARDSRATAIPPALGEQRSFNVCTDQDCDEFATATATVKAVGEKVAIYVDNEVPAGGYSDAELAEVGTLFDDHLYHIDTTAFGRESDIDGNGVVLVLLTPRVNALSPHCSETGSVIIGYFFGADLLPSSGDNPGSNEAEIFYGLTPDPTNLDCEVPLAFAREQLPSAFIHEFQHMISFNQHVLVRRGRAEETWLNEGLSHFAEELGARQVPAAECPVSGSCAHDFMTGNLQNAFAYLTAPEDHFLIEPDTSGGELPERGANWLFVRWLVDHFAGDSVIGSDLTRRLVETRLTGGTNVQTQTAVNMDVLLPEWQMTNYLDDLPGFEQPTSRLRYKTWNFREAADSIGRGPYPLSPDVTDGSDYAHTAVLRAGSGKHLLITQPLGGPPVDTRLTGPSGEDPIASTVRARIGLVRIR